MPILGDLVRQLRSDSSAQDIRSFAEVVGMSYEGLRKIELGDRVPSPETTERFIETLGLNKKQAKEFWWARDMALAEREGILHRLATPDKVKTTATKIYKKLEQTFDGLDLSDEDKAAIISSFEAVMEDGLCG